METKVGISPSDYIGDELEFTELAINYHRAIYSFFSPYIRGRVLELGSGSGSFTKLLLESKPDLVCALEPSNILFPVLQKRFEAVKRLIPVQGTLDSHFGEETIPPYQTAVLVNVLEHIEDDARTLKQIYESLDPSGHLLLFVPALTILYGVHDKLIGHFRRYSRKELRQKCEEAGFHVLKIFYFDLIGAPLWFLQTKVLRRPIHRLNTSTIKFFDNYLVPLTLAIERRIKLPFGKSLVAICKKS